MRKLQMVAASLFLSVTFSAHAANYCLAIRGNGELEPAHWGAVANVVERLGMPEAQAGGSSGSITMFLLDAVATNPAVSGTKPDEAKANASLMIKSFQGLTSVLTDSKWSQVGMISGKSHPQFQEQWNRLEDLLQSLDDLGYQEMRAKLDKNIDLLRIAYNTADQMGLVNLSGYRPLWDSVSSILKGAVGGNLNYHIQRAEFYLDELRSAFKVLGAFNAKTDANLFFRPGILDFNRLADELGSIGAFYAQQVTTSDEVELWDNFFAQCSQASMGLTWDELVDQHPQCGDLFTRLVRQHFNQQQNLPNFADWKIGVSIPSFPATAVLIGRDNEQARSALTDYADELDPNFGADFKLKNPNELRFGFWGSPELLDGIQDRLPHDDEASRRFINLGEVTWRQVLEISPAEPGLSPFIPFQSAAGPVVSAGGWGGLHPVLVLKGVGCTNVVYVTRKGAESVFAQGVAKRLLGLKRAWSGLSSKGDPKDQTSLWSRLFNLANPKSSLKRALNAADAVLCTNWDSYSLLKDGVSPMVKDAFTSPYYVGANSGLKDESSVLSPALDTHTLGTDGHPINAGCF